MGRCIVSKYFGNFAGHLPRRERKCRKARKNGFLDNDLGEDRFMSDEVCV
jgi:hypothetical protein